MKNVAAQSEQEQMGVRGRRDRQKQGKPIIKGIGTRNGQTKENLMSAKKFINLCRQERNHGWAGEEVRKALWKEVAERAISSGN